jgi:hypothetical protein
VRVLQNGFLFHVFDAAERLKMTEIHRLGGLGFGLLDPEPGDIERRKEDEGSEPLRPRGLP